MAPLRLALSAMALLGMLIVFPGCQTNGTEAEPYPKGPSRIFFQPRVYEVPIQADAGSYPNLFTGASMAVWDPEAARAAEQRRMMARSAVAVDSASPTASEDEMALEATMDADMEAVPARAVPRSGPLEIVCTLESVFPDRSIAYDAVGLRGMDVFLELPDGSEVLPVQRTLDPNLSETPEGALRRYSRKLTLHFPSRNFMVENPAATPVAKGIRLVLTGLNSTFYFEWHAVPDTTAKLEAREDYQVRETVSKGYRTVKNKAKDVSHTFD